MSPIALEQVRGALRRAGRNARGRQPQEAALAEVRALIGPRPADGHPAHELIEHLHRVHDHFGALFDRHVVALAHEMRLPQAQVHEVASFYHHFLRLRDDEAAPRATLRVCTGLSCAMAGAHGLLRDLAAQADEGVGQDAGAGAGRGAGVRVVEAPCIGRCDQAPAALATCGGEARSLAPLRAGEIVEFCRSPEQNWPPTPVKSSVDAIKNVAYDAYRRHGGYARLAALVQGEDDPEAVLATLEAAGLRGLGGAGFPAARKWRIVRGQPGPRHLVVNIDEGEPGTFKDRWVLERDPHRMIEGALIAAQVVGCESVWFYLRDEYPELRTLLARELAALQAEPPCPLPHLVLRRGAGAYICGEESALIESLEGRRGQPRLRPPYIAERGLFGRPTLAHNAETLHWLPELLEHGPEPFSRHGRHGRTGLRRYSVSGRVREPGVKLAPAGITARELIDEYCGGMAEGYALYAYLPGGASGGIFPAALADVPLDFDTLQPHGGFIGSAAVIVLGRGPAGWDRARDAALAMMRFFADESCGQCTPCRVGTGRAAQLMAAPQWDAATLADLARVMADASICGLGQAAPNPMLAVLRHFPDEVA